ncbi:MAG: hypothetical protein AAGD22_06195 [Verrucomicrobiota bacterium]
MESRQIEDETSNSDAKEAHEGLSREQIFEHGNFEEIALNNEDDEIESADSTAAPSAIPQKKDSVPLPAGSIKPEEQKSHRSRRYNDRRMKPVSTPRHQTHMAAVNPRGTAKSKVHPKDLREQFARLPSSAPKPKRKPIFSISFLRKNLLTTLGLIVLAVLAGIIFVIYQGISSFYGLVFQRNDPPPAIAQPEFRVGGLPIEHTFLTSDMEQGALEVIHRYLEADGWKAKLPFVRNPDTVKGAMEAFYNQPANRGKDAPHEGGEVKLRAELIDNERLFIKLALPISPGYETKTFIVEKTPAEAYKVDWEITEQYQELPLERFMEKKPSQPVRFRVQARLSDYFNYHYKDEEKWLALELRYPGNEEFLLHGYIERDTNFGKELSRIVRPGIQTPLILSLGYPITTKDETQVQIYELISTTWLR